MMSNLIEQAAKIAIQAHAGQMRKDDAVPYIIHPFMVALLLTQHGFSEVYVAAALVHDVLEDTPVTEDELRTALGSEVLAIVLDVSEDKTLPWEERKRHYIESVRQGSEGAKAVSLGDKIHNLRSLLSAYEQQGPALWKKFNRGREEKVWFENEMLAMFQATWHHPMIEEYEALISKLNNLV